MFEMIGPILGGLGQLGGGIAQLTRGGGSTPDNSTFYQNWRNDDMAWSREQFQRNEDLQREFAQNGIRWRVSDARAAGLHPLAAIGAAGSTYSPTVTAGGGNYQVDQGRPDRQPDIGSSLANMGQGLGRAISATQTPAERVETASQMMQTQQQIQMNDKRIQMADLDLQIKASQLAAMQSPGTGPGLPNSVGPHTSVQPAAPEAQVLDTTTGGVITHPSRDASKAEDEFGSPLMGEFLLRNRLGPLLGGQAPKEVTDKIKSKYPGSTGAYFDVLKWEWHPTYHSSGKGLLHRYVQGRRETLDRSFPNSSPREYHGSY